MDGSSMGTLEGTQYQKIYNDFLSKEIATDVSELNHNCNGHYEFTIYDLKDIDNLVEISKKSYEMN